MPTNVVRTPAQEKKWNKAKAIAAKEGKSKNYAYIMGIFKNMGGLGEETDHSGTLTFEDVVRNL